MGYSNELKKAIIEKLLATGRSQKSIADEAGVSRSSVQNWIREYRAGGAKNVDRNEKRPQDWTAEERFQALIETEQLSDENIGSWCRRHGLHTHHLKQWRDDAVSGCGNSRTVKDRTEQRRLKEQVRSLEKELIRKDKALAETAALLVLRKKANAIWGDGEEG